MPQVYLTYQGKYLTYQTKLLTWGAPDPPPIPDFIQITPTTYAALAGGIASEAICLIDSSINGIAADWNATITLGGAFITLDTNTGSSGSPIYVTIDQNTTTDPRQGSINFTCGTASADLPICQDGTVILCSDL